MLWKMLYSVSCNQRIPSAFDRESPVAGDSLAIVGTSAPSRCRIHHPPVPRVRIRPNHPGFPLALATVSCFVTPSLPRACLPFCGGGGLSLPGLSSGWQHGPTYIPATQKGPRARCELFREPCYNNRQYRRVMAMSLSDSLAPYLVPEYHKGVPLSRGILHSG